MPDQPDPNRFGDIRAALLSVLPKPNSDDAGLMHRAYLEICRLQLANTNGQQLLEAAQSNTLSGQEYYFTSPANGWVFTVEVTGWTVNLIGHNLGLGPVMLKPITREEMEKRIA